jgi:uncharacterized protein YqgV (UPF0045/DUF77 family)
MNQTLQAGEIIPLSLTGKFLIVRKSTGDIVISSPDNGLPDTQVFQSDIINLEGFRNIYVKNNGSAAAVVNLQSSKIPIVVNDGGSVTISGGSIDSILEPIQVTASATVENGTVTPLSNTKIDQYNDITIEANQTVTVIEQNLTALRRVVQIQNISDIETLCRVGGANVASGKGAIIKGSIDAIASWELDTIGIVKIHNESNTAAKIAICWGEK